VWSVTGEVIADGYPAKPLRIVMPYPLEAALTLSGGCSASS